MSVSSSVCQCVTLQLPDLLRPLAVVPPLRVQRALNKQELLLQLRLLSVCCTALLLQITVQTLQLAHRLCHLCVALPQPRRRVRLHTQQVVGPLQLPIKNKESEEIKFCAPLLQDTFVCVCVCVYCTRFCNWTILSFEACEFWLIFLISSSCSFKVDTIKKHTGNLNKTGKATNSWYHVHSISRLQF